MFTRIVLASSFPLRIRYLQVGMFLNHVGSRLWRYLTKVISILN
jgi:hypothetical protein